MKTGRRRGHRGDIEVMTRQIKELKMRGEKGRRPRVVRQATLQRRSINRLRESGLNPDSVRTVEINEEYGLWAGSPQETVHNRLETHFNKMRGLSDKHTQKTEQEQKWGNADLGSQTYCFCTRTI